ncbi:CobW family GTP-binding protein [Alteromonas oceanisediminis]|uniref:CobW family GTP-binding protein n=1 Tax=Alteromonas oceanisediminis TaxID=2836180 RepID=UPI001BD915CC|nr:GTP-binding protein [Alteromonas oceanisediminis]MBT0585961.1 GTP-binding protein [Alteromonas oceanisediminis]
MTENVSISHSTPSARHRIENVPTNIITGALGAGKTTLIRALLATKPAHERWAILVNEFGEVGIDGAILESQSKPDIFIREVPGGCMCCTAGLPMQIALNMLLARAKPDRLLIEPTGLGHPKEVLESLSAPHYEGVLDIRATLALIDARKLADERWRKHPTFREQLCIADTIVMTKSDLYSQDLTPTLRNFTTELGIRDTPITTAQQGCIPLSVLAPASGFHARAVPVASAHKHIHAVSEAPHPARKDGLIAPAAGAVRIENSGEGFYACGWLCAPSMTFTFQTALDTFSSLTVERLKAVLRTEKGIVEFNLSDGTLHSNAHRSAENIRDSRIEFITQDQQLAHETCQFLTQALALHPG